MSKPVIIIGAGGHGKVIADIVLRSGDTVLGFLDDRTGIYTVAGIPVLGPCDHYSRYQDAWFVLGIGNAEVRERLSNTMAGVKWYKAIHPSAFVSPMDTSIGEGTVVMAGAVINPGTKIGKHCIVNTGAIIDHDNQIESLVHISVGAKLAGAVHIGKHSWIGIGAVVKNNVSICENCMIGAGAVVVKDIIKPGTYVGVPAHKKGEANEPNFGNCSPS